MYKICIILSLAFLNTIAGQTITGSLTDSIGNKIIAATIVFSDTVNKINNEEFVISSKGYFNKTLTNNYTCLQINIKANGYKSKLFFINNPDKAKLYTFSIILQKQVDRVLEEVIVKADKKSMLFNGDTVTYNVKSFLTGDENKLQEVLKKMPGIDVDDQTGKVSYKGKEVETINLEGDNLFGKKYTTATKNINVNMVEKVQAIDHYYENPLLKGLGNNDKVALNLVLKKGNRGLVGDLSLGLGNIDKKIAADVSYNLLDITKNIKSYATLSYNNIGANYSPFDKINLNLNNLEELDELSLNAPKYISDNIFTPPLKEKSIAGNNDYYINYNGIKKLNDRGKIKFNLYHINALIESAQFFQTTNVFGKERITTSDNNLLNKKPIQWLGEINFNYQLTKKSSLEYWGKYNTEPSNTTIEGFKNNTFSVSSNIQSTNHTNNHKILYTNRLNNNSLVQTKIIFSDNSVGQQLHLTPFNFGDSIFNNGDQNNLFSKNIFTLKSELLGRIRKNKYSIHANADFFNNRFVSETHFTNSINQLKPPNYANNIWYQFKKYSIGSSWQFALNQFYIDPSIKLTNLTQKLLNDSGFNIADNKLFVEPTLTFGIKANNNLMISASIANEQNDLADNYLNIDPIVTDARNFNYNTPSISLQNKMLYSFNMSYFDLHKQRSMMIILSKSTRIGDYFQYSEISKNSSITKSAFILLNKNSFSTNLNFKQYISIIKHQLNVDYSYSSLNYFNFINNSILRENRVNNHFFNCLLYSNFKNKFNYKLSFGFTHSMYTSQQIENLVQSFTNTTKLIYKINSGFYLSLKSSYYLPDMLNKSLAYLFWDYQLNYKPTKSKFNITLDFNNILNTHSFKNISANDYSTSSYTTAIFPRYILLTSYINF